jgi:hypothetical protein
MLARRRFPFTVPVVLLVSVLVPSAARSDEWSPAVGTLTCQRDTDIRMISQELVVDELQRVDLGEFKVWAMDVEARYVLKNTSKAKKKPDVMFPVCRISGDTASRKSCDLKKMLLKVRLDGRAVSLNNIVKQDDILYVRFSPKFAPKMKKEVAVSYRHFETREGWNKEGRPFAQFDYRLSGGGVWQGKVGLTRIRIRAPYKADKFCVRVISKRGKVERETAFATWKTAPFDPDPDETLSLVLVAPAFRYKVELLKKKLKRTPGNPKRHLAMARLVAPYTPAASELVDHLSAALKRKFSSWKNPEVTRASTVYAHFLDRHYYSGGEESSCEPSLCESRQVIEEIIPYYCQSDETCLGGLRGTLNSCCGSGDSASSEATDSAAGDDSSVSQVSATPSVEKKAAPEAVSGPAEDSVERKAFFVLVGFIALVWISAGVMIAITIRRHRRRRIGPKP